jgi:hypothetical protein
MGQNEDYSIKYVSSAIVRNGNNFAIVYREGDEEVILMADAYRASATSTKYEISVPSVFLDKNHPEQLSEYGKKCLMRIRQFIDNEIWEFQGLRMPDIALDKDYGLPNWSLPDDRPYEKELLIRKAKGNFVIRHGGLSDNYCSYPHCNNHALRGENLCVDHFMSPKLCVYARCGKPALANEVMCVDHLYATGARGYSA